MNPPEEFIHCDYCEAKISGALYADTTSNTNHLRLMLCIIIVIDDNYKSRIVATEDETQESFCWIFDILYQETGIYLILIQIQLL